MALPQLDESKMKLVQELEIEMMTDMYARLVNWAAFSIVNYFPPVLMFKTPYQLLRGGGSCKRMLMVVTQGLSMARGVSISCTYCLPV